MSIREWMRQAQTKTMKKQFFSLLIALGVSASAAFAQIEPTLIFEGQSFKSALNVNNDGIAELAYACINKSGSDIEIMILSKQLTVEKQFTIKNTTNDWNEDSYYFLEDFNVDSFDLNNDIVVSRNFLVKNDKWCVVVSHDVDDNTSNYFVFDEDGNNLGNFPRSLPNGSSVSDIIFSEFTHGVPYMTYYSADEQHKAFYTFTGKSGIEPTMVSSFKSAYPNPLPAGQTFNVSLPQAADDATFFCVTDMKGRQICRKKVAAGETTYRLTGSRFSHGHYVYTVIYGDGTTASGRLMAE